MHHHWDYGVYNGVDYFADVTVDANTRWTLYTGGKSGINRQSLFAINATAYTYDGTPPGVWNWSYPWQNAPIVGVTPTAIKLLGGSLGSDGTLWTVQPDNTPVDLGLVIPSQKHTSAWPWQQKYKPYIGLTTSTTNANLDTNKPGNLCGAVSDTWSRLAGGHSPLCGSGRSLVASAG